MFGWFKRLFAKPRAENEWNRFPDETSMNKERALWNEIQQHCPECHAPPMWYEGPSGGLCTNIFCGHCGQGYNVTPLIGIAEKIKRDESYIRKEDGA